VEAFTTVSSWYAPWNIANMIAEAVLIAPAVAALFLAGRLSRDT